MHLPVVDVAQLESPGQHFKCEPYRAKMRAASCVARQKEHQELAGGMWRRPDGKLQKRSNASGLVNEARRGAALAELGCADCELGRRVAEKVGSLT